MTYEVIIDQRALKDIQEAIDYYDEQQFGLGEEFERELNKQLRSLGITPFFQVRYEDVRCMPLKKYPYMVHFTVDDKNRTVTVRAVFNTSRDPGIWRKRK